MNNKSKYADSSYIGKIYGNLEILEFLPSSDDRNDTLESAFICKCRCNRIVVKKASRLVHGKVSSCGMCTVSKYNSEEYIDKKFGGLTIKRFVDTNDIDNLDNVPSFLCECQCGNTVIKKASHAIKGNIQSCGKCHETRSKYANKEFIGQIFGKLEVVGIGHDETQVTFICNCTCGRSENIEYSASMIYNGYKKQCNICAREISNKSLKTKRYNNSLLASMIGERFGKLVVKSIYKDEYGVTMARCDCDCGTKNKDIILSNLYRDKLGTKACGKCRVAPNSKYDSDEYIGKTINNLTVLEIKKENSITYWKCRCELCDNHTIRWFKATGVTGGNNKSCGCMQSNGETIIEKALKNRNIMYRKQVTFKGLKGIRGGILRFDFGIYDANNKLLGLIEYDGAQHFIDYNKNYYLTEFELVNDVNIVRENDKIKNKYCEDNKIQLIRLNGYISEEVFFTKMKEAVNEYNKTNTYVIVL